ncbi:DNA-directed RNA polymerase subunit omega [Acidaminococcus sp.]|uniref:DNA-directed RNA polymerase subunit omega n=1 Tax=Acidaminococcus sp. TaxID=1872103 RepID=UPI003D7CF661
MSMIDPSIDYLADKVGSKYALVIMASKRARQLVNGAPALVKCDSNKPVSIALKEIAEGLVTIATPEEVKEMEKSKQK